MRPRTPLDTLTAAVPPALLLGLAIALVSGIALDVYFIGLNELEGRAFHAAVVRSSLAGSALWLTTTVLIAVGLGEAGRRSTGVDRNLFAAASFLIAVVAVRALVSIWTSYLVRPEVETLRALGLWGTRVTFVCWLGASVCVAATLRRDTTLLVGLGAALVVGSVIAHPSRMVAEWILFDWQSAHGQRNNAIVTALYEAAFATAVVATLVARFRAEPALPGDTVRVAAGVARVGSALVARVVIALGFAFTMMMAIGAKSPGLAKVGFVLFPGATVMATIALVSGLLQAAGEGGAPEPPRLRFTLAAGLSLGALVMTAIQSLASYRLAFRTLGGGDGGFERDDLAAQAGAFPYLVPGLALAGLLCLVSALSSLRAQRGPQLGTADPTLAAVMLFAFTLAAVVMQRWMVSNTRDTGSYLLLFLAVAVANVIAQLAVARLCHKVAEGLVLDPTAELPTARIHAPE